MPGVEAAPLRADDMRGTVPPAVLTKACQLLSAERSRSRIALKCFSASPLPSLCNTALDNGRC